MTTTALGKFEKMAIAPVTPFTEIDDWLYGVHFPELPTNRSHVADAELNKLLVAQRREMDPKRRREIVDDIQRYLVDKAYYVYLPWQPPVHCAPARRERLQAPRRLRPGLPPHVHVARAVAVGRSAHA